MDVLLFILSLALLTGSVYLIVLSMQAWRRWLRNQDRPGDEALQGGSILFVLPFVVGVFMFVYSLTGGPS